MELQIFISFQFCILLVWSANGDAPFQGKFQVNLLNDVNFMFCVRRGHKAYTWNTNYLGGSARDFEAEGGMASAPSA